jgi:galactokinase
MAEASDIERLRTAFTDKFGGTPQIVRAPGRVNLIGEHTDYNDGFVLPAALELATYIAARPRDDRTLRIHSLTMDGGAEFDLDEAAPKPRKDWTDYVRGVAIALAGGGTAPTGADLMVWSDVPMGGGLSSSAAIEVATGYALMTLAGAKIDLTQLALAGQKAENEFVGMRCGIMDQFIACRGEANHALLLDCRSLEWRLVPLDPRGKLVICNTMAHHAHAGGEYNLRRRDCEEGVKRLSAVLPGITALRDVSVADLDAHASLLPETILKRCRHVVTENDRTVRAADALAAGDLEDVGKLMAQSHVSMRDDFEISCAEVDTMVGINAAQRGVFGARMTGGGFGGCTISLVEANAVDDFIAAVGPAYEKATGLKPAIFTTSPGDGVGLVD